MVVYLTTGVLADADDEIGCMSRPVNTSSSRGIRLYWLQYPYTNLTGPLSIDALPRFVGAGTLLLIRAPASTGYEPALDALRAAQKQVVNACMVLWLDEHSNDQALALAAQAGAEGVSAVVSHVPTDVSQLRQRLASPRCFQHRFGLWIEHQGFACTDEVAHLIRELAKHACKYGTLKELAAAIGPAERHWQRSFRCGRIGTPGSWFQVLRLTRIAMKLQAQPLMSVNQIALQFGFSSGSVLSDRFWNVAGVRPAFTREHLGWKWFAAGSLRRAGVNIM